jgi:phospholipid transport system substrate-binding protein
MLLKNLIKICIAALLMINSALAADNNEQVKDFINNVSNQTITIISDNKLSNAEKEQALTKLFTTNVDIAWIGKFALGRYYKTLSPEQKTIYNELFNTYLVNNYIPNFKKYTKESIKLLGVSNYSSNEYLAQTQIIRPSKEPLKVNYMIKQVGNDFKIFDIIAEGVSLINTQRSEFGSILVTGNINNLIDMLKTKIYKISGN